MNDRRVLSILCVVTLAGSALYGCSAQTADETGDTAQATDTAVVQTVDETQTDSDTIYAQVQSIDGTTVTRSSARFPAAT
jgi:hypothetical protein